MNNINVSETVARIATEHPESVKVFQRHRIDFCCGGRQPLEDACRGRGLDPNRVIDEVLSAEASTPAAAVVRWDEVPLAALIDHIVTRYHRHLDQELPRIEGLAQTVYRVHGSKDPERFRLILDTVMAIRGEVEQHLTKEEEVVFPWLRGGERASAGTSVAILAREHETLGGLLDRIHEATWEFTAPPEACATWQALWHGLEALEHEFHEHIHLENNVLFPRALAG